MPASRPQWKGYLKLSLVSCPIAIYPAVSAAERISFRQIDRNTGNRLRQQLVDAVTGETVDRSDKARGYELGKSSFLSVRDEELEVARQQAQARRPGAAHGLNRRRRLPPPWCPSENLTGPGGALPRRCLCLSLPGS